MINNKRAQNSTIGVTIAIILGIFLIVFLIWGFSTNWTMFRSTSGAYGSSTVDIVKRACVSQCENGFETEFCLVKKEVIDENGRKVQATCSEQPLDVPCSIKCNAAPVPAFDGDHLASPSDRPDNAGTPPSIAENIA